AAIVRRQPVRRARHGVEQEIVDARLIEDDMRVGRQPVLDILDEAVACDVAARSRLPERGLVDPIGLALDALADAEGLEHLHRPAGDAVGLAELQWTRLL